MVDINTKLLEQDAAISPLVKVRGSCFVNLLKIHSNPVGVPSLIEIFKYWDTEERAFRLPDNSFWAFSEEDVAMVYGLPYHDNLKDIVIDNDTPSEFAKNFCVKYNIEYSRGIKKGVIIKSLMDNISDFSEEGSLDVWRLYVLVAFGSLFQANTGFTLDPLYLHFLQHYDLSRSFNWAALIKETLVESIDKYVNKPTERGRPKGDMHCLMVIQFI